MFRFKRIFLVLCSFACILPLGGTLIAQDDDKKPKELTPEEKSKAKMQQLMRKAEEEYRIFFRKPEKPHEFWVAIRFEIDVGKYELAAMHLKLLLEQPAKDVDPALIELENAEGMSGFLKMHTIRKWSDDPLFNDESRKNVQIFLDRMQKAVDGHLSDPVRINKYIRLLEAPSGEEKLYALVQLKRSREKVAPHLVEILRTNVGKPLYDKVRLAMYELDADIIPPLLEVLKARTPDDAKDVDVRLTLLDVIRRRGDKRAIPYLWHLAGIPQNPRALPYPPLIRTKARETLASLMDTGADRLPPADQVLAQMAERYFRHQVRFAEGRPIKIWTWDGEKLLPTPTTITPRQAEEFYGKRFAREALDLNPKQRLAQEVLLSLHLERTLADDVHRLLLEPLPPSINDLLLTLDADLLADVLDRALDDANIPIVLPILQALGERGDPTAARVSVVGAPRGIHKALFFPDRRVQFAALRAMLKMPATPTPVASLRMIDLLTRNLATSAESKAVVAFVPDDKAAEVRAVVKGLGFQPFLAKNHKDAIARLSESNDFDVLFMYPPVPGAEFPFILNQIKRDADLGRLPIIVLATKGNEESLQKMAERHANVTVIPEIRLSMPEELESVVKNSMKQTGAPKLTKEERAEFSRFAIDKLWRMARGEITGYDVRPAQEAILAKLKSDHAIEVLEILGRLPGADAQGRLTSVVLDASFDKLRMTAALELNRHVQKHGLLLNKAQIDLLKKSYVNPAEAPALRNQLALIMAQFRARPEVTGLRLQDFRPDSLPPPPEKKEKEKEKDKKGD